MIFLLEASQFPVGILFFIAIVVILIGSWYFSKKNRMLRELKKTKPLRVTSIKNGAYVKVIGKALHIHDPLVAPISQRECIFYQTTVIKGSGKNAQTIIEEIRTQDFFLEQNGEMVLVKMDQAHSFWNIHLDEDHSSSSGSFNDAEEHLERYLIRHGEQSTGVLGFNKAIKYNEGIIAMSEKIVVKGIAEWRALKEPIEGYQFSKILTLRGSKDQKLIITDLAEAKYKKHS